ncbi:MAG: hypothetical protein M1828_002220 [Chrysothrix sp. TS-e1954]|nr:MAG: hypothetical protein M1828_002220 [Chrysothrix sp. TS-e1954]
MAASGEAAHDLNCLTIGDLEQLASVRMDKQTRDYYNEGADSGSTLLENTEAYSKYRIRPRVLRDISNIDISIPNVFGHRSAMPLGVAPTAMQCLAHPDGEVATAKACGNAGVIMGLSSFSTSSLEDVAQASGSNPRVLQLYLMEEREHSRRMIMRAKTAGYKAVLLTVDTPMLGRRNMEIRNQFKLPKPYTVANFPKDGHEAAKKSEPGYHDGTRRKPPQGPITFHTHAANPTLMWDKDIDWLKQQCKPELEVWVKGVTTAEDAELAVDHGVDGIIVSNHGGRQLNGALSTIDALPEVVEAVRGRLPVHVDGGIRHGTDVFKALALGASFVWVGRPILWGLSYNGQEGVEHCLRLYRDEIKLCMGLAGTVKVEDINKEYLVKMDRSGFLKTVPVPVTDAMEKDLEASKLPCVEKSSDVASGAADEIARARKVQRQTGVLRKMRQGEEWLDRKLGIELQGIDRIPEDEKRPPPVINIFLFWFSLNCHIGVVPLGILGPTFGLSLKQTIASAIIGNALGALCTAYTGTLGPRLGLRQIGCARYSFGFWGAKVCSLLNIIVGGGFAVVNFVVVGQILSAVSDYTMSIAVGIVIIAIISYTLSVFGFRLIHTFEKYSWIGTFILLCVLLGQVAPYVNSDAPGEDGNSGVAFAGTFLTILSITFYYSSGLSLQLLGHYFHAVPRFIWSLLVAIVVAVLAIAGQTSLETIVNNFVSLLGYWTVSFTLVLLIEDKWFRRNEGYNLPAWDDASKLPWGAAAVLALLCGYLAGGVTGMSQTWYIGPVARKFGGDGGDVGIWLSGAITLLVYPIARAVERRITGR